MGCSCSKQEEMYHTCTPRFTLLRKSIQPYNFNYSKSSSYTALRYTDLPGAWFPIRVQNFLRYTDLCSENLELHDFMMTLEYFVANRSGIQTLQSFHLFSFSKPHTANMCMENTTKKLYFWNTTKSCIFWNIFTLV